MQQKSKEGLNIEEQEVRRALKLYHENRTKEIKAAVPKRLDTILPFFMRLEAEEGSSESESGPEVGLILAVGA